MLRPPFAWYDLLSLLGRHADKGGGGANHNLNFQPRELSSADHSIADCGLRIADY